MAKQFAEYLREQGLYAPQSGSLADLLEKKQKVKKIETKPKKLWTYHYPNYKTGTPVAIQAYSQTEARQKASAMGLPTTEVLPSWRGPAYKKKRLGEIGEQVGAISKRVKELRSQLGGGLTEAEIKGSTEEFPTFGITDFSKLWETEYKKSGLEDIKNKIAKIDAEITARKEQRDKLLLDEMGKPIPQWMITGRKELEIEAATADINRLIDQRNSLASQYNTGIAEVEKKVGYAIDYQKELAEALREEAEAPEVIGSAGTGYYMWDEGKGDFVLIIPPVPEKPTEYKPPTSYQEWVLAGKPGTFEEWLRKEEREYTPTQERAADRERELLRADIQAYKDKWAKTGDVGAGTREEFIRNEIEAFRNLTPDEIRNIVYTEISDEWLRANRPTFWTWPWGRKF